jgi:hypothetical protein
MILSNTVASTCRRTRNSENVLDLDQGALVSGPHRRVAGHLSGICPLTCGEL